MKLSAVDRRSTFSNTINLFILVGIWTPESISQTKKHLYVLYSILFVVFIVAPYILSQVLNLFMVFGDLEAFSESSFVTITVISEMVKCLTILTKQTSLKKLIHWLNTDQLSAQNSEQHQILMTAKKNIELVFRVLILMYNSCVVLWGLFPLFDNTKHHSLPFPAWFPFSLEENLVYILAYIHQVFSVCVFATLDCALDVFVVSHMIHISAQLDILANKLQNGVAGFCQIQEGGNLDEKQKIKKYIFECATHYENIFKYVKDIESIFSLTMFLQFSSSGLIICMTLFQMLVEEPFSIQFLSTMMYQSSMISQIFFYCWCGNEITLKSAKIPTAAYFSDWYKHGSAHCRSLHIIMTRAAQPLQIKGGYFFILSADTFTTIVRSAWSFFAVLRTKHSQTD